VCNARVDVRIAIWVVVDDDNDNRDVDIAAAFLSCFVFRLHQRTRGEGFVKQARH